MSAAFPPTKHDRVITIDGPAAAGKSTVARKLADRLGAMVFDTGALYRAVALLALRSGIEPDDAEALCSIARNASINIRPASQADGRMYDVWLDGIDVTWDLRAPEIGAIVSRVSEHRTVRAALLPLQRRIASSGPVVMVGRDIGTVVVPDAGLKVYLDATPEERARRRHLELSARGSGESFAEVLEETMDRDRIDSQRSTAPLSVPTDAMIVATDALHIEKVVDAIESVARSQQSQDGELLWPR